MSCGRLYQICYRFHGWSIYLPEEVEREILPLPADLRARFAAIWTYSSRKDLQRSECPICGPLGGRLWEMRMKGRDGIARAVYFSASGRRPVVVHAFVKKTEKTPQRTIEIARRRMEHFDD